MKMLNLDNLHKEEKHAKKFDNALEKRKEIYYNILYMLYFGEAI
jgi:hypothetical protein